MVLRESQLSDIPFLREMLFEAVYWRAISNSNEPKFEDGLAAPEVSKILADWGEKEGDAGVVAMMNSIPVGAVWYRYWNDQDSMRGYISESIPTLVIAVHKEYRRLGIGREMIEQLAEYASGQSVEKISLMVSKDNYALELYKKCGFVQYAEVEDSFLMTLDIVPK